MYSKKYLTLLKLCIPNEKRNKRSKTTLNDVTHNTIIEISTSLSATRSPRLKLIKKVHTYMYIYIDMHVYLHIHIYHSITKKVIYTFFSQFL